MRFRLDIILPEPDTGIMWGLLSERRCSFTIFSVLPHLIRTLPFVSIGLNLLTSYESVVRNLSVAEPL